MLFMQTVKGKYESNVTEAWGWYCQNILPTLSLIISVFIFDSTNGTAGSRSVEKFHFNIAFFLSLFYLLVIMCVIFAQPFAKTSAILWLQQSNIYLAPLQGIATGAIGIFFIKKSTDKQE
jgi:cytochrome bd-type quinol oxidase subunit 2